MKNKGFSLIEVIVAVAIIASLSGIVGLNLRRYMANAKDAKAISTLHSVRTAIQLYQLESNETLFDSTSYQKRKVIEALAKLEPYLDNKAKSILTTSEIDVGGSRTEDNEKIKYGGKVRITFIDPNGGTKTDGFSIWLEAVTGTGPLDMKGNKWIDY